MKFQFFLVIFSALLFNDVQAQPSVYAMVPYSTGFESNTLDSNWYTATPVGGRIRTWPSDTLIWGGDTAVAHTGNYWLGLDNYVTGTGYKLKEAWMGVNTAGLSGLRLAFWWTDWDDEIETQDGVWISDDGGLSFVKVIDLPGDNYPDLTWNYFNVNLDSINAVHSLTFTANYVIKFQEYDDYYFAGGNDGFMFDDISVGTTISGVDQPMPAAISLFPNPSTGVVYVNGLHKLDQPNVRVLNNLGEIVSSSYHIEVGKGKIEWEGVAGIYMIEILEGTSSQSFKVVKE